ncbi:MAG: ECF-type sigma factor [Planctomycetota bacterium]
MNWIHRRKPTMSESVSHWIERVKAGDSVAVDQIWHQYFDRLVQSVRVRMRGQDRAVSDEEDVALSVFDSFYEAARAGRFPELSDRNDLWFLLLRMSARKIVDKHRRETRKRRGGGAPIRSIHQPLDRYEGELEVIGDEPTPEMVLMMQETVEQFFSHLGVGQLRELAGAKLEGYSNADLADRFECSERTIERRLHLIREICQQELLKHDEHSPKEPPRRDS